MTNIVGKRYIRESPRLFHALSRNLSKTEKILVDAGTHKRMGTSKNFSMNTIIGSFDHEIQKFHFALSNTQLTCRHILCPEKATKNLRSNFKVATHLRN